ncbi:2-keto-4-pentenoate hydratase [Gluconobacter wancherniae]|uniref:2-keto-4-pentenoate hydratase n=1 Tax=Gluconobacter wancherniae TaxID=1307955 RepID=UPI002011A15D|nr:fumarylacetoacetate hydrolase family protein [Gluconobacter wancherniae]
MQRNFPTHHHLFMSEVKMETDFSSPLSDTLVEYSELLLGARKNGHCLQQLQASRAPQNVEDAYAVQDRVANALISSLGSIQGWKVGAPTPDSEPFCAPLHQKTIFSGNTKLPAGLCRFYGVEAEIVYIFGASLPLRSTPWTEQDIRKSIISAHAAIEIFDTRFCKPGSQSGLTHLADQGNHGALIYGAPLTDWQRLVPVDEPVRLILNGKTVIDHVGGNSAGDPMRLLVWLANHAAKRGFPIQAGTVVTTGSMTGTEFVSAGTVAEVQIGPLAQVSVTLP